MNSAPAAENPTRVLGKQTYAERYDEEGQVTSRRSRARVESSGVLVAQSRYKEVSVHWCWNGKTLRCELQGLHIHGHFLAQPVLRSRWFALPNELEDKIEEFLGEYGAFYLHPLTQAHRLTCSFVGDITSDYEQGPPWGWPFFVRQERPKPQIQTAEVYPQGEVAVNSLQHMDFWLRFQLPESVACSLFQNVSPVE